MRRSLATLLALAPLAFAQTQTFTYTYSGLPIPIYPDSWDTVAAISIFVPRSIAITKVTASVQVQFSGVGDLNVYLWSAEGTRVKLLERNCAALQNIDTTFDDSASSRYADFCPAEAGRGPFRGNEPLSNANGQNAYGYWRIGVENNGSDRTGSLTGFSVTITGNPLGAPIIGPNTIVSSSSFRNGTIAPGDHIVIGGVNLGPTTGVRSDTTRALPTSSAGTSVTFDGTPAPLFYVSDRLVVVHAPTSLTAGSTTRVQVVASSGSSTSVQLAVVGAKPGIFTYESGGSGQAKAINQDGTMNGDGTINTAHTGAAKGSIISVFASGLGQVAPTIAVGNPAPNSPLSPTVLPVTATIGGRTAHVLFAGAAPGQIGVYQVNIMVPETAPSGNVRLVLTADGNSSQSDVTVRVR